MRQNRRIDEMSWADVKEALEQGFRTIVFGVGSNEQHGPHLPLANDSLIGDWLAETVARRLGKALVAPTIRVGCSDHHMAFPGTISLTEETLEKLLMDYCRSLSKHGFKTIVIIPSHGGNFKPVANALSKLAESLPDVRVTGYTDLEAILEILLKASDRFGISRDSAGAHAGEFETSMTLFLRPDLVDMSKAEKGFVGDVSGKLGDIIEHGIIKIAPNGILGDATQADVSRGEPYLNDWADAIMEKLGRDQIVKVI